MAASLPVQEKALPIDSKQFTTIISACSQLRHFSHFWTLPRRGPDKIAGQNCLQPAKWASAISSVACPREGGKFHPAAVRISLFEKCHWTTDANPNGIEGRAFAAHG
jgi:hypothetical protein